MGWGKKILSYIPENTVYHLFSEEIKKERKISTPLTLKNSISIFIKVTVHVIFLVVVLLYFFIWVFHSFILKTKPCRRWPRSSVQTLAQLQARFQFPNIHTPDRHEGKWTRKRDDPVCSFCLTSVHYWTCDYSKRDRRERERERERDRERERRERGQLLYALILF